MSASPVDVVVSGGGIGGAVLAELLARRGKRVVVLERNTSPPTFLRPELLWPASIDVLCGLHPRETWETEVALPVRGIRIDYGRDPFAAIGEERLRAAGVAPWFVNPNDARELLLRRARFEVRRGVEVVSILRAGDRVSGVRARDRATGKEDDVPARLTIGDDGEHSIVRAGCGIPLETRRFPVDFLCFGIEWPASFERGVARVWIVPGGRRSGLVAFAAMPFVRGKGAGLLVVRGDAIDSGADLETPWRDLRAQIAEIGEVAGDRSPSRGMTRVRRHFGHAPRYGCDGAFLLGDAAHPVSPAGGQGANMSIADARVLGRLLVSGFGAGAGSSAPGGGKGEVLREYELERRRANSRSVGISRTASRALSLPATLAGGAFSVARFLMRRGAVVERVVRYASRSFVE